VTEERDTPEHAPTIWLMKMAPRRWFRSLATAAPGAAAVDVSNALTRAGALSFQIFAPEAKRLRVAVSLVATPLKQSLCLTTHLSVTR
jgi:hypothetical protein